MLRTLHIENIAVIKCVDVEFGPGFTVLSGETGAGKSILIDSVNLLIGGKFSRDMVRAGESSALVSGLFDNLTTDAERTMSQYGYEISDGDVLLQRSVYSDGKSIFRLNGRPCTATIAREIGGFLLSIHGQNDNQRLLNKATHLSLLDAMGDIDAEKESYALAYAQWKRLSHQYDALRRDDAEKNRRVEMLRYQIQDIEAVNPRSGEEVRLAQEREKLRNLGKIQKNTKFVEQALDSGEKNSVTYLLGRSGAALRQIIPAIPEAETLAEQLDELRYQICDMADTVRDWCPDDDGDPTARLDAIEGRLEMLSRLQKKYGETSQAILEFRDRARAELETLEHSEEHQAELQEKLHSQAEQCRVLADTLSEKRRAIAVEVSQKIQEELAFLDMPKVRFHIAVRHLEQFTPTGLDNVEFLIATNPGEELKPMEKIASGGELSRLMLALKSVLNDRDGVGTVVFDEIDVGISGKTSRKIGIRLRQMGRHLQVICITHAAQIASLADTHIKIVKQEVNDRVETNICVLDEAERVEEIARILGGLEVTSAQRTAAREMLEERFRF